MEITDERTLIREIKKAKKVFVWIDAWQNSWGEKEGGQIRVTKKEILELIEDTQPGGDGFNIVAHGVGGNVYVGSW